MENSVKTSYRNFESILNSLPREIIKGTNAPIINFKKFRVPKRIIISGMGGSALVGDILKALLSKQYEVCIHKNYFLPEIISKDDLVVIISHSGGTEETISGLKSAIKNKLNILAVSTGGEIKKISLKYKIPWVDVSGSVSVPRLSTLFMLCAVINTLEKLGLVRGHRTRMIKWSKTLNRNLSPIKNKALKAAKEIKGKIPIIYTDSKIGFLGYNFKAQLNENAKILAFYNVFPELNHNETVGFEDKLSRNLIVLMFVSQFDNPRNRIRQKITSKILQHRKIKTTILNFQETELINLVFHVILFNTFTAFYLAKILRKNPFEIKSVDYLKKELVKYK